MDRSIALEHPANLLHSAPLRFPKSMSKQLTSELFSGLTGNAISLSVYASDPSVELEPWAHVIHPNPLFDPKSKEPLVTTTHTEDFPLRVRCSKGRTFRVFKATTGGYVLRPETEEYIPIHCDSSFILHSLSNLEPVPERDVNAFFRGLMKLKVFTPEAIEHVSQMWFQELRYTAPEILCWRLVDKLVHRIMTEGVERSKLDWFDPKTLAMRYFYEDYRSSNVVSDS